MTYVCPKDSTHLSDDADYCSVCGTKIGAAPLLAPSPPPASGAAGAGTNGTGEVCPDCGLARNAGAKFCEVCRYDFEAHTSAAPSTPALPPAPLPGATAIVPVIAPDPTIAPDPATVTDPAPTLVPDPAPAPGAFRAWQAVVAVDPSLYFEPDPLKPCPVGEPERTFPLDLAENLIGRRSDRLDIHPEVPLSDTGVSHRHAKILRQPEGILTLLDLGSTNGTQLNDKEIPAGIYMPLKEGDQITLGCWTRITITAG